VIAVDGIDLVTTVDGSSGTPLVFIHGSNGGLDSWADIAGRITGHRTVRYARRNYSPSGTGKSRNTFQAEADDLLAVVAALGEAAHLVGGSYGATVALHAVATCADQIKSLALFEPPLLMSGPHLKPVLDEYRSLCAAEQFGMALTLFLRAVARVPADIVDSGLPIPDDAESALSLRGDLEAMSEDSDDVNRWQSIRVPALLMQGGQSWSPLPEGMERLAAALPHAERVIWPDQSHFATAAVPGQVADAIQRFVDGIG
jgi:pimeloyl-ACP methyl ester carboxylesterase